MLKKFNISNPKTYSSFVLLLALYSVIIFVISSMNIGRSMTDIFFSVLQIIISLFVVYYLINYLFFTMYDKTIQRLVTDTVGKKHINIFTFLIFSLICWLPLCFELVFNFPGRYSPDTMDQWNQVQTFTFNNWHPVAHTLLIWIITRIVNHYAFVVFVQISLFSVSVGYLIATLEKRGFSKLFLLITGLFIAINPYTREILMYPWKDLALTIFLTFLTSMVINIYYSNGSWFENKCNIIAFSIVVALSTLMRHNSIFFTIPLLLLIVSLYIKKTRKVVFSMLFSVIIFLVIRVPLYSALNVSYPSQTYVESVGIPMTIMSDVLVNNPDRLSDYTKDFLYTIASDEEWNLYYKGNYNSIKFNSDASSIIETVPVKQFMKMFLQTIIDAPTTSMRSFFNVTSIVWKLELSNNGIFKYTGWYLFFLLFFGCFSLARKKINVLMLFIPSVLYNLGTMLLLSGDDTRFFHFNVVITLPILFVLLSNESLQKNEEHI